MRLRVRAVFFFAVGFVALVAVGGGPSRPPAAGAQQSHRAAVVVDLGDGSTPRAACVSFDTDSISGIEALRAADMSPEVYGYSQGAAVCAICGKGCPAGGSCLTCKQPWYWAYSRAPQGSSSFTYWGSGAGRSTVRDGDVEGWRWTDGSQGTTAPAYQSVDQVCAVGPWYHYTAASSSGATTTSTPGTDGGAAAATGSPTTTEAPASAVAPPAVPGTRASGVSPAAPATTVPGPAQEAAPATSAAPPPAGGSTPDEATPTTAVAAPEAADAAGRHRAGTVRPARSGGAGGTGSAPLLALVAVVVAGLALWRWLLHRRRAA